MNKTTSKPTLQSSIILGSATVNVKFRIAVDKNIWEVTGFLEVRTGDFTPELVGVFSVQQFANDSGLDLTEFVAQLKNMVKKNLNW